MIASFALFDIANFVTPAKRVAPPLLIVAIAAIITPWPTFAIGAAAIVMSLLAANPFAADERGRLDTLYATLPLSRSAVVIGRYVSLTVIYLLVVLAANILAVAVPLTKGAEIDLWMLGMINLASVIIYALAIAVQLPFFFSVGFTRARPMMYIPVGVVAGLLWLAGQTGLVDDSDFTALQSIDPVVAVGVGVGVSVVALVISAAVSSVRYGRRSL